MKHRVGIRREDKNEWEARVPITPGGAKELIARHGIEMTIQPSTIRVFDDNAYSGAGVTVDEDLSGCPVVIAVKEIPTELLLEGRTYMYFSHTIKGQSYNMDMLRRLIELKCTLIDYETVVDDKGRRLIFFGRHAGLAGMIDTLWTLGERLAWEGADPNPFTVAKQAYHYRDLDDVRRKLAVLGEAIEKDGLPADASPVVFGFAGYGNVSLGAQEIVDLLPVIEVAPADLAGLFDKGEFSRNHVYKTVFREEDMVEPCDADTPFDLQDYYDHPEKYRSIFDRYWPFLSVLVNCIYWTEKYPRLITRSEITEHYGGAKPRLKVVGDISCDPLGSVEFLLKTTATDNPVYVYDTETGKAVDGVAGKGPVMLGVDNLPCELALESSRHFSESLLPFIDAIASADYGKGFSDLALPDPIKKATILHCGVLTPDYGYMEKFIA